MTTIAFVEFLTWARIPPLILFLVQYRGKWRSPTAWMLRGMAFTTTWQAFTTLAALITSASISSVALRVAIPNNILLTGWAYFFYWLYLKAQRDESAPQNPS
jgi:hypothetical protein